MSNSTATLELHSFDDHVAAFEALGITLPGSHVAAAAPQQAGQPARSRRSVTLAGEAVASRTPLQHAQTDEQREEHRDGGAATERPRLRLVAPKLRPSSHSRVFVAALTLGTLAAAVALQLFLSILTAEAAYEISSLEQTKKELTRVERVLEQNVQTLSSPQNLAENASKLGMAVNATPSYLRLSDGAILGQVGTRAQAMGDNTVPNELLSALPLVTSDGEVVDRAADAVAAGEAVVAADTPQVWEGPLPAPKTR